MRIFSLCILLLSSLGAESLPVDISFFITDMKYSEKEGIKICELQQGTLSAFSGYDYAYGTTGHVQKRVAETLFGFQKRIWYVENSVLNEQLREELNARGARSKKTVLDITRDPEFQAVAKIVPSNPVSLADYQGIVIASPFAIKDVKKFKSLYPGIIVLDEANYDLWIDKYKMSCLFTGDPVVEQVKPVWKLYQKQKASELAEKINAEIPGEIVVIKPRGAFKGEGVLIVEKAKLEALFSFIFSNRRDVGFHKDPAYKHWATDTHDSFIVEAFHASDLITAPQYGTMQFNGSLRAVFMLIYNNQEITVEYIGCYWILPLVDSVIGQGTLNQLHKSYPKLPHFTKAEEAVSHQVEAQLKESMPLLYKKMLGQNRILG